MTQTWHPLPIRSQQEWDDGVPGGEGKQHPRSIHRCTNDPDVIYFAHDIGGIWRSTDGGVTWHKRPCRGLHGINTYNVWTDPANDDHVYVLAGRGFQTEATMWDGCYRSTDGAQTFARLSPVGDVLPNQRENVTDGAGGSRENQQGMCKIGGTYWWFVDEGGGANPVDQNKCGVFKATDPAAWGGSGWTRVASVAGLGNISRVLPRASDSNILCATDAGLRLFNTSTNAFSTISTSGGVFCTWIEVDPNDATRWWCVKRSNTGGTTVDASARLLRSTDSGATWTQITTSMTGYERQVFAQNNGGTTRLHLVGNDFTNQQIRWTDNLSSTSPTWTNGVVTPQPGLGRDSVGDWYGRISGSIAGLSFHPSSGEAVAYSSSTLFRTLDAGANWVSSATGFVGYAGTGHDGRGLIFDAVDPDKVTLLLQDTGFVQSGNNCQWWTEYGKPPKPSWVSGSWQENMMTGVLEGSGIIATSGPNQKAVFRASTLPTVDKTGWTDVTPGTTARGYHVLAKAGSRWYCGGFYNTNAFGSITTANWQSIAPAGHGAEVVGFTADYDTAWALKVYSVGTVGTLYRAVWRNTAAKTGTTWGTTTPTSIPADAWYRSRPVFAAHPTDDATFFTRGTDGDLIRCTYNAGSAATVESLGLMDAWNAAGMGTDDLGSWQSVVYIAIDPDNPDTAYAACEAVHTDCIWRTTDLSSATPTWENISEEFPPGAVRMMAVHPWTGDLWVSGMHGNWVHPPPVGEERIGHPSLQLVGVTFNPATDPPVGNDPPTAIVAADVTSGVAPTTVNFDGTGSTDDGTIVSYAWDFGDGTTDTGSTVSHTYTTPGQWFASLTVTDDDGAVDVSSQFVITITEPAPGAARSSSPGGPDLFT